jgi:hypothetical protein
MSSERIPSSTLDAVLALQMTVAWAGEGLCEPKRLDWWRTDLVDEAGGGDLFKRLFPKTHQWASLEAVREVAIQTDRKERDKLANPDALRTLFFWGASIDEQLHDRLAEHKRNAVELKPSEILPLPFELDASFDRSLFETTLGIPNCDIKTKVVPGGRLLANENSEPLEFKAKKLAAALLPLVNSYPMPMYRIGGS